MASRTCDVVIVGGGHNALVAAILLRRAGFSVRVLERSPRLGGAAVSAQPFAGVAATISRYSYLVSLFPRQLAGELGLGLQLRRRRVDSCTPDGERALVVGLSAAATEASFLAAGLGAEHAGWQRWQRLVAAAAARLAPTLTEPLRSAADIRQLLGGETAELLLERPLADSLRQFFSSDLLRGLVLTDGLIGTFARSDEKTLRQNRCLLYHVIGNGHGRWDVPVGGMGRLTGELVRLATEEGAELCTGEEVVSVEADDRRAEARTASGRAHGGRVLLCGAAPSVLEQLLGRPSPGPVAEGAQVKLNLLVDRLPRLACGLDPELGFAGTLHVNERHEQLDAAYDSGASGSLPDPVPCEVYCHSLSDASILSPELRRRGVQALSVFALQTPARLFAGSRPGAPRPPAAPGAGEPAGGREVTSKRAAEVVLASLQSLLAEPLAERLLRDCEGRPCVEVHTPVDLEQELRLPAGHIFHRDLQWPWAEAEEEVGRWGVETDIGNVLLCGSGARRGGAVSGIAGHNAARAAVALLVKGDAGAAGRRRRLRS